ncbi:Redox-sensitive bicupin YhaK, pirin superfamily [Pseudomonas sp. NFACC32-1]|uniref:pirin family protein n=1 Tax=Pseudomonas sp. NFACC32-1 TaxID=1566198 RepID=UPI000876921A|nr:pirin family protein [Pseudomonas sp. NFACC32-1]SCX65849.1 Redox-sensitive bicupin YhaK, pirin superfamily [Pseudomonas sp. NFACC32-1]
MGISALGNAMVSRRITHRTRGHKHGPIVRLMSPSDLGQLIKPFVFLDLFEGDRSFLGQMAMHPHSGIATVTVITEGNLHFDDPESGSGEIAYGGVEWMRAGGGVWHGKEMSAGTSERVQGFQLWIALPPDLENAAVDSQYLEAAAMPEAGPARVILGHYAGGRSPVRAPEGINYLLVTLSEGTSWEYTPPAGHDALWLSVARGQLTSPDVVEAGEMVVFEPGSASIRITAGEGDAVFVIGSAIAHPIDLHLGYYSVHTSPEALRAGEQKIAEIGLRLREQEQLRNRSGSVPIFK